MSLLKISLLLLGVGAVSCHRPQFRGSKGPGTTNMASGLIVSPLLMAHNSHQLSDKDLWKLHSANPWAPKIVKVEVTHELIKEWKPPKIDISEWKPVIPAWKSPIKYWKPEFKHKTKVVYPWKSYPKKESWQSHHVPHSWNEAKSHVVNHALWNKHGSHVVKPHVHAPTHAPSTHWTSSDDYDSHQDSHDDSHDDIHLDSQHDSHHDDNHDDDHHKDRGYKFNYEVESSKTGDVKTHEEKKKDGVVEGKYTVKEADGSIREVHYTAGKHTGFKAVVVNRGKISGYHHGSNEWKHNTHH